MVKKVFLLSVASMVLLMVLAIYATASSKKGSETLTVENITKALKDMGIAQGNVVYVKSADTTSKAWKSHLFRIPHPGMEVPLVVYTNNTTKEIVIGILIKNKKLVIPKISPEYLFPREIQK